MKSLLLCAFLLSTVAHAQTTIPGPAAMTCSAPNTTSLLTAGACQNGGFTRNYAQPIPGQLVLACDPSADPACLPGTTKPQPNWSTDTKYHWYPWPVPPTWGVLACGKAQVPAQPWTAAQPDPCTNTEDDVNKPLLLATKIPSPAPVTTAPASLTLSISGTLKVVCPVTLANLAAALSSTMSCTVTVTTVSVTPQ